jgi:spore germination cell wall hydrolase CwlJ-like protein
MSAKATGTSAAHRRADGAIAGAAFAVLFSASAAVALAPRSESVQTETAAATIEIYAQSPVEQAANAFAAEQQCLAEVMYYEARGEGEDGQKAVAEVVMTRMQSRYYPDTVCEVVHQGATRADRACQFSFACDGSMKRRKDRAAWERSKQLAAKILSGAEQIGSATHNATAFHTVDVSPVWANYMERVTQIGNHIFYRRLPYAQTVALQEAARTAELNAQVTAPESIDPQIQIELPVERAANGA